jgi:hypothetical protein
MPPPQPPLTAATVAIVGYDKRCSDLETDGGAVAAAVNVVDCGGSSRSVGGIVVWEGG